jgi:hypothetical protein
VTPTTLPTTLLPRARGLTDALLAPATPPPPTHMVADACRTLRDGLAVASRGCEGAAVRVDAFAIRTAGDPPRGEGRPEDSPFRWTPRRARRTVGVRAAARVVHGRVRCPAQGAEGAVAALVEDARRGGARPGSLGEWLGTAPPAVVGAVLAESTAWATHLVTAIEWDRVGGSVEVGGPDRWWDLGGRPTIGLRGRVDVRLSGPTSRTPGSDRQSLLTLVNGRPGPASRIELGLAALVDVLRHPSGPAPARVVGWWPECGRALVLDVGEELLTSTAAAALVAVRSALQRRGLRAVPAC